MGSTPECSRQGISPKDIVLSPLRDYKAILHPDVRVFAGVTGGRIPGLAQYRMVIETVRLLRAREKLNDQSLARYLAPYWLEVIGMSENNMADRAHFLKIFEQLQERAIRETLELPAITEDIESKCLIDGQVRALAARMGRRSALIEDRSRDKELQPAN